MARRLAVSSALLAVVAMVACGGGGSNSNSVSSPAPLNISISTAVSTASVFVGEKQVFSATVSNSANTAVNWSVIEHGGGTITSGGVYMAPLTAGTYHVVAAAAADTAKTATIAVTVPQVSVTVTPATASLTYPQTAPFSATVANSNNATVTWSVVEANGGSFNASGTYSPPTVAGTYHINATANADGKTTATAVATVTVPAPVFASTAPTSGVEGTQYSYLPATTESLGNAVTYSLTTAPAGAVVSGSTVTWTPSHAQSRVQNDFVLVATTSGGMATQSWSVTPMAIAKGTKGVVHHLPDGTTTNVPFNFVNAAYPPGAFIPNGNGGFNWVDGVRANGSFTVAGVPPGHFWLCWQKVQNRNVCVWTNDDVDFSTHTFGRVMPYGSNSTFVNLAVSTTSTVHQGDTYEIFNPNADLAYPVTIMQVGSDGTSFTDSVQWSGFPLLDASLGDLTYVSHFRSNSVGAIQYWTLDEITPAIALTVVNNTTNTLSGTTAAPANSRTVRLNIAVSEFEAQRAKVNPTATNIWFSAGIALLRSDPAYGFISYMPESVYMSRQGPVTADFDTGDISVGDPYPQTWIPVMYASDSSSVKYNTAHFGVRDYWLWNETWTTQLPSGSTPLGTAMSPVENPKINGVDFFQDQPSPGTNFVLSWNAPAKGTPTGYYVSVITVASPAFIEARYYTTSTSIQLPPGAITPGIQYVFVIYAESSPGVNYQAQPLRQAFPYAISSTASGLMTP